MKEIRSFAGWRALQGIGFGRFRKVVVCPGTWDCGHVAQVVSLARIDKNNFEDEI